MPKPETPMPRTLAFVRIYIDPEAVARLTRMADAEGRTKQRQMGILLEGIAKLYRESPDKLEELGLLSPFAAGARVA